MPGCIDRAALSILGCWDKLTHPKDAPTLLELRALQREFLVTSCLDQKMDLHKRIVKLGFENRHLVGLVKKVFNKAMAMTEGATEEFVLQHPEEYAFLTKPGHFFDKHLKVLREDWNVNAKVTQDLTFTHLPNISIPKLMNKETNDVIYDLDQFAVHKVNRLRTDTTVHESFQRQGDGQRYMELVGYFSQTDAPSWQGQHFFIRLIDEEGKVISMGKYPDETGLFIIGTPNGAFHCADECEWTDGDRHIYRTSLTEEQYTSAKAKMENPADGQHATFNFLNGKNCTDWAVDMFSECVPLERNAFTMDFAGMLFPKIYRLFEKHTPKCLKVLLSPIVWLTSILFQPIRMLAYCFAGGFRKPNPLISSWKDFFDPQLSQSLSPFYLKEYLDANIETLGLERG